MVPNHRLVHCSSGCWLTSFATVILHAIALGHANTKILYFKSSLCWYVSYITQYPKQPRMCTIVPSCFIFPSVLRQRKTCSAQTPLQESNIGRGAQKKKITWGSFHAILPSQWDPETLQSTLQESCNKNSPADRASWPEFAELNVQPAYFHPVYGITSDFVTMVEIRLELDLHNSTRSEVEMVLAIPEIKC